MLLRLGLVLFVIAGGFSPAHATDVASCGQEIAAGDTADLTADLDCSGPFGVELGRGATLAMHGHTITMEQPTAVSAVNCANGCRVVGPGALVHPRADVSVDDAVDGVRVLAGRLVASDLDVSGFNEGINATLAAGATLTDVDAHGCSSIGISGRRLKLADVTANDNGTVALENFHGAGISGETIKGHDVTALNNVDTGIAGATVILADATVAGGYLGVSGISRVKLIDSSATGALVYDVRSVHLPKLVNTTCDHSGTSQPPFIHWGVCALD